MTKILNLSLLAILILHLCLAANFELSHDEAYYWLYSLRMDWGFFDHPPVVGLIIKMFSFLPHSELAVRAGFIVLQLVSCLLLLKMVAPKRQLVALILFFAFPLASFSGLLALPDLPLLAMTTVYCLFLKRFLDQKDSLAVVGLGTIIPLLLYSKYHGILVVFFTLLAIPSLFKRKDFYLVTVISILLFLPHVLWQYEHNFSTLRYHFFERPKVEFSVKRLLEYSVTQIFLAGLFTGPIIWWTTVKIKTDNQFDRALKFICLGTFVFFFISTFSKKFEANWTIFLTAPLILLAVKSELWDKKWIKILLVTSLVPVFLGRFLFVMSPEIVSIKRLKEFNGWKQWTQEIAEKCQQPVLANTYQMASKFAFYLNKPVHALNYHSRKNQFDYWQPDPAYYLSPEVCYVTDKKEFGGEIVYSPEGKKLRLLKGFRPSTLGHNNP